MTSASSSSRTSRSTSTAPTRASTPSSPLLRCLFWFNPLVHIGANAMRIDQEMSCDAEVIARRPRVRRAYAETLLKTQLASRPLPVGCYWPAESQHPLAQRIDEIARAPISRRRRLAAAAIVMTLTTGAGVAAWAAQPERTIFRETADVLVPFEPLDREGRSTANLTRPRLIASAFKAPAVPQHWRGDAEVTASLCVSATGRVESVALTTSSGDAQLDAATLRSLEAARFTPATAMAKPSPSATSRSPCRSPNPRRRRRSRAPKPFRTASRLPQASTQDAMRARAQLNPLASPQ